MASGAFQALVMIFMLISGGSSGNDLLDMLSSDSYWHMKGVTVSVEQLQRDAAGADLAAAAVDPRLIQDLGSADAGIREAAGKRLAALGAAALVPVQAAAQSPDPVIAAAAEKVLQQLSGQGHANDVRRLMAIRTLGERHEKGAEAILQKLLDSKEPFVSDYARRALSIIDGTPLKRVDHSAGLAADLALFPRDTGIVGQTTGLGLAGFTLDSFVNMMQQPPHPGGNPLVLDKPKMLEQLNRELLSQAERLGNIRADGASLAVSHDIGGNENWVVISFHGQYDPRAAMSMIRQQNGSHSRPYKRGEMDAIQVDNDATFLFPSDHQLILVVAQSGHVQPETIFTPVMLGLTGGKGELAGNKELNDLIAAADKTGPAWAVGIPSASMKTEPILAAFDSMTLTGKADANGGIALTLAGKSALSAEAMAAVIERMGVFLKNVTAGMQGQVNDIKTVQPVLDFLQSIKVAPGEGGATMTATLSADFSMGFMAMMAQSTIWMLQRMEEVPMPPGQQPMPMGNPAGLP